MSRMAARVEKDSWAGATRITGPYRLCSACNVRVRWPDESNWMSHNDVNLAINGPGILRRGSVTAC